MNNNKLTFKNEIVKSYNFCYIPLKSSLSNSNYNNKNISINNIDNINIIIYFQ